MRRSASRQARLVCRLCTSSSSPQSLLRTVALPPHDLTSIRSIRWTSTAAATHTPAAAPAAAPPVAAASAKVEPLHLAAIAQDSAAKFLSVDGIPAPQLTTAALESCLRAARALNPHLKRAEAQSRASASRLVQLGAERTGTRIPDTTPSALSSASARISRAAYSIATCANVHLTPEVLDLYVQIHAHLNRPESLPHILDLYARKPRAHLRAGAGAVTYAPQNPQATARAIEPAVAEAALGVAIEARHLDAALGIIEAAYCAPAFRRHKLLKHATPLGLGLAALPFGVSGLAGAYAAYWQNTMDVATATGVGVAGISGYLLVVGSLGMIAKLSNKDQMRRVTWTPGTPLRYRWLREEERAALDTVACAWGFREKWRHGEETGPEWEGLKEYMGYRGMLLDRVEFMEGMS